MSGRPSPLTSPTASGYGLGPTAQGIAEGHLAGADGELDGRPRGGREPAFAVTEQDGDLALRTGDNQVELAVAVDVARGDVLRAAGHDEGGPRRGLEQRPRGFGEAE